METFKTVATQQLGLLWYIFMVGTVLPLAIPANACGTELLYQRVVFANYFLVRATIAAAVLLFTVKICVGATEASAIAAAHAATVDGFISNTSKQRRASLGGMLLFAVTMCADEASKAHHEAAAAATVEGLSSVAAKWKRVSLRGMLLLAVALSAAASFLAIVIFEDWCQYMSSCNAGYGLGSPCSVFMMVAATLWHGFIAWVAVCKN